MQPFDFSITDKLCVAILSDDYLTPYFVRFVGMLRFPDTYVSCMGRQLYAILTFQIHFRDF